MRYAPISMIMHAIAFLFVPFSWNSLPPAKVENRVERRFMGTTRLTSVNDTAHACRKRYVIVKKATRNMDFPAWRKPEEMSLKPP